MQSKEVDILGALTGLLKTLKETDKLASKPLDQWPTYAATLRKCTEEERHTVYQCQNLNGWEKLIEEEDDLAAIDRLLKQTQM